MTVLHFALSDPSARGEAARPAVMSLTPALRLDSQICVARCKRSLLQQGAPTLSWDGAVTAPVRPCETTLIDLRNGLGPP